MNPVEEDRALDGEDEPPYDLRRGREAMDPVTRQLAFLASGIGLLLVVLIGGWLLSARHAGAIPVIEPPSGPVRVKPIDPGGMQAMGAQSPPVMSGVGSETLAPQPETPRPEALQAEIDAARGHPAGPVSGPGSGPGSGFGPAAVPAPAPNGSAPGPTAQPTPQPAPLPIPHATAVPARGDLLRTDASPDSGSDSGSDFAAPGARLTVQLAALDTHAAAELEWSRLCRSHPALFSGRAPQFKPIDHDGRTLYRLRMGGFANAADANAFCAQARAQRVACTLADF